MGLFSRKQEAAPEAPPRRDKVMKLVQATMAEQDAVESPGWEKAIARVNAASDDCTVAERRAAHEAARRHGY